MSDTVRLQVFLSRNGVCSRREAMDVVKSGRVAVNGRVVAEPSFPVDSCRDQVSCDGKPVGKKGYDYVVLNKPGGYITTKSDAFAPKTVMALLPQELRHLNPVGRLDKETEGLLILTNDGDLLHALTHPGFGAGKVYHVRVKGEMDLLTEKAFESGMVLDGKTTSPAEVRRIACDGRTTDFEITIHEGWNRQIRRMCAAAGLPVRYLKRVRHGALSLGDLAKGQWRRLTDEEVAALKRSSASDSG